MPGTSLGTKDPKGLAHDVGQYGSISTSVPPRDGENNKKGRKTVIRMSDVTAADIVCGRGYQIESYRGNQCMHRLIDALREEYLTSTKKQKAIIVNRVVHELKIDHGARFLRLIEITNHDDHDGTVKGTSNPDNGGDRTGAVDNTCFEFGLVDDKVAHDKVAHAFRCKHRNRAVQSSKHLREEKKVVVADGKAESSLAIKVSYNGNGKRAAQKSAANPTKTAPRRSVNPANHQMPQQEYSSPAVVQSPPVDSLSTLRSLMSPQSQPQIPQVATSLPFQFLHQQQQEQEQDLLRSLSPARSSLLYQTLPSSSTSWIIHHNLAPRPSPSDPLAATVVVAAASQAFVLQQQLQLQQQRFVLATDPPQPSLSQAIVALVSHEHHRQQQQQQQLQLRQILATYLLAGITGTTNNNNNNNDDG